MRVLCNFLVFGLAAIVSTSATTTVDNANLYIDTILKSFMPVESQSEYLDPTTLGPIQVIVTDKSWMQHKFRANFSITEVKGLSNGVFRYNDCSPPGIVSGYVVVGCYIRFSGINIKLEGMGYGDTVIKKDHAISAKVTLGDSNALVEAMGPQSHAPGSLRKFQLAKLAFTISTENIDLTSKRMDALKSLIDKELTRTVTSLLTTRYFKALDASIRKVNLPPV